MALGIPLGVLASFVAWWIITRLVVPKVEFSPDISRTRYNGNLSGLNYRIKFKNCGRRDIIDVQVSVLVRVKGLSKKTPKMIEIASLALESDRVPVIRAKGNRIIQLRPERTERFSKPIYGQEIYNKLRLGNLTLDDVLALGTEATVTVFVFGYDSWSGARKMYESSPYRAANIKQGPWKKMRIPDDSVAPISSPTPVDPENRGV